MTGRGKSNLLVGILLFLASFSPAWAQVTAAISGHVQDPSGAGVSDAMVTVKNLETGGTRAVTTDMAGDFRVLSLELGQHEVKVEKTGFKAAVRNGINLEVGQDAVVKVQLEVGQIADAVTVSGDAPLVNTTTSSVSGMVGEESVKELPLNGQL
jgi:hypothetical protein